MNIYSEYVLKTYSKKVNEIRHLSYVRNIDMYLCYKLIISIDTKIEALTIFKAWKVMKT